MAAAIAARVAASRDCNAGDARRRRVSSASATKPSITRIDGVLAHGGDQRRHDGRAGHVAAHMHDAPRRMRGLAADRELAFEVAIERHAIAQEIVDARAAPRAPSPSAMRLVDEAGADARSCRRRALPALSPSATRGGDAALRPRRRGALAERCGGKHGDRTRRQLQRAEQSGKAAADDDDVVVDRLAA